MQSPLHLATYLNLSAVVKSLVGKGASLELQDQDGNTALHVACQHGQTDCASEMIADVPPSSLALVLETQNWRGEDGKEKGACKITVRCVTVCRKLLSIDVSLKVFIHPGYLEVEQVDLFF